MENSTNYNIRIKNRINIEYGNHRMYSKKLLSFRKFISHISNNPMLKIKIESIIKNVNHSAYLLSLFNFEFYYFKI